MIAPTLPTIEQMQPALDKLARHGGVVLISIRHDPEMMTYAQAGHGYFSPDEAKALRSALQRAKKKREQGPAGNPATEEKA